MTSGSRSYPQNIPPLPSSPTRSHYQPDYDPRRTYGPNMDHLPQGLSPDQLFTSYYGHPPPPHPGRWPPPRGGHRERTSRSHSPRRGDLDLQRFSPPPEEREPPRRTGQSRGRSTTRQRRRASRQRTRTPPPEEEDPDGEIEDEPAIDAYITSHTPAFARNLIRTLKETKSDKWSIRDKATPAGQLSKQARLLHRFTNPFLDGTEIMTIGMTWFIGTPDRYNIPEASLSAKQRTRLAHERECLYAFEWLKEHVAFFADILPNLVGRGTDTILIGSFIDTHARQARATDINTLKRLAPELVHPITLHGGKVIAPPTDAKQRKDKHYFGFHANWTALQIVPTSALEEFMDDPEGFRDAVLDGDIEIDHRENPYFLYASGEYDPYDLEKGLLQGEPLRDALRAIFTSPSSVMLPPGTKSMGRGCISHIYKIRHVEPRNIAYIAILWRNVVSSCPSWQENDGEFHGPAFFKRLVALFDGKTEDDERWANETLAWWNTSVYGDDSTDQSGRRKKARRPGGSAKTQEDILTEQRKARADARAALVPPLPSPGEGPNPEAEPTEHPIPDPLLNGPDNPSSENQEEDAA